MLRGAHSGPFVVGALICFLGAGVLQEAPGSPPATEWAAWGRAPLWSAWAPGCWFLTFLTSPALGESGTSQVAVPVSPTQAVGALPAGQGGEAECAVTGGGGGGSVLRLTGWLLIAHLFAQFVSVSLFYLSRNCPGFSLTRVMGTPTSVTMGGRGGVLAPTSHTPQADGHSTVDSRSLSSPGRVPRSEGVQCPRRLPQKDGGGRCCAP